LPEAVKGKQLQRTTRGLIPLGTSFSDKKRITARNTEAALLDFSKDDSGTQKATKRSSKQPTAKDVT